MYTSNPQYHLDIAKAHREREIQAAQEHRLAREARTARRPRSSGIAVRVSSTLAAVARRLTIAKTHAPKA